jgi:hypothetical protein
MDDLQHMGKLDSQNIIQMEKHLCIGNFRNTAWKPSFFTCWKISVNLPFIAHVIYLNFRPGCAFFFPGAVSVALLCILQRVEDRLSVWKSFWLGVRIECIETLKGKSINKYLFVEWCESFWNENQYGWYPFQNDSIAIPLGWWKKSIYSWYPWTPPTSCPREKYLALVPFEKIDLSSCLQTICKCVCFFFFSALPDYMAASL